MERFSKLAAPKRAGITILEVLLASTIMAVVVVSMMASVQQEADDLSSMVDNTYRERSLLSMVQRIENELEFAAATQPQAFLQSPVTPHGGRMRLDGTLGFPPTGIALINPGGHQARIGYRSMSHEENELRELNGKLNCEPLPFTHPGMPVFWAGSAFAIENQTAPLPSQFDGQAMEATGPLFFRGDGTGFSFRVPTDPSGGNDYFDASGVTWGSQVNGTPTLEGWSAIDFRPEGVVTESALGFDVNLDGDQQDEFELGRMRLLSWNAWQDDDRHTDVGLGPAIVLQERCNHGGDLNGDGFADPIFLWNEAQQSLSLRFTVLLGDINEVPVIRRMQTTLFLRNGVID